MNLLPSLTRSCARQTIALRPTPSTSTSTSTTARSLQPTQRYLQPRTHLRPSTQSRTASSTSSPTTQPARVTPETTSTSSLTTTTTTAPPNPSSDEPSVPVHHGTVTRTGTMTHTIQISVPRQHFDKYLQKHFQRPERLLAHDPNPAGFLREGDVVEYGAWSTQEKEGMESTRKAVEGKLVEVGKIRLRTRSGRERKLSEVGVPARKVRWVVRRVLTPFGVGLENR